jgi:hypothetical protein
MRAAVISFGSAFDAARVMSAAATFSSTTKAKSRRTGVWSALSRTGRVLVGLALAAGRASSASSKRSALPNP